MIIAVIRSNRSLEKALKSDVKIIIDFSANVLEINERVKKVHKSGKEFYVHIDVAKGIENNKSGIEFLKKIGVDGILTKNALLIKTAKEVGVKTIQRFFIVDSESVTTAIECVKFSKPDMIDIVPGTVMKEEKRLNAEIDVPIIASGMIKTAEEAAAIMENGAFAIATERQELWM